MRECGPVWRPWSRSWLCFDVFHRSEQTTFSWRPAHLAPRPGTLGPPDTAETTQRGGWIWEEHRDALKEEGGPQGHQTGNKWWDQTSGGLENTKGLEIGQTQHMDQSLKVRAGMKSIGYEVGAGLPRWPGLLSPRE